MWHTSFLRFIDFFSFTYFDPIFNSSSCNSCSFLWIYFEINYVYLPQIKLKRARFSLKKHNIALKYSFTWVYTLNRVS